MPFWDERVAEMHKSYPDITVNSYHIDALTTYFVSVSASSLAHSESKGIYEHPSTAPSLFRRRGRIQLVWRRESHTFHLIFIRVSLSTPHCTFAQILSDLGPALTGSLGVAASGNINPTGKFPSLFEPVHGSAPGKLHPNNTTLTPTFLPIDIAGKYIANPVGMIEAASMMLRHLGEAEAADEIIAAINAVLARANSAEVTRDLGGQAKTEALGDAINKELLGRS